MKKYYIIAITVLTTVCLSLTALLIHKAKRYDKVQKIAAQYMRYYNSSEELYDLLEEEGVLEPYLESQEGSEYLENLNKVRKVNWDNSPVRIAKLVKPSK